MEALEFLSITLVSEAPRRKCRKEEGKGGRSGGRRKWKGEEDEVEEVGGEKRRTKWKGG